ncbi:ADP-ribosylation factor-like protein 13B [Mactra antiquata]
MFTLMGNCISSIRKRRQPKRPVTLAILGLDSAGKTTTTKCLLGETLDTAPTVGFNKEEVTFLNYEITLYDLGGGSKIRDIWKKYLAEIYGIIYLVDSSAPERFPEVKQSLESVLENEKVQGKPLLILANKEDIQDHVEEVDIMEQLNIEDLVNVNKCYCKMAMCSAIKGTGRKMDPKIKDGMTWMCGILDKLYDKLKVRIDADMEVVEQIRQKEAEERKERVRKIREERERQQEEERKKLGEDKDEEEEEEEGDFVDGDPFRRLDSEEIKRKDEKYKKSKAKEKERQKRLQELEEQSKNGNIEVANRNIINVNSNASPGRDNDDDDDDNFRAPRSSRSLFGPSWMDSTANGHSRHLLPPLESPSESKGNGVSPRSDKKRNKKLKNKVESRDIDINDESRMNFAHGTSSMSRIEVEPIKNDDDDDNDSVIHSSSRGPFRKSRGLYVDDNGDSPVNDRKKKTKKKQQNVSSDGEDGFDTLRLSQHIDENDINGYNKLSGRGNQSGKNPQYSSALTNGNTEERSVTPVKKLKKKKNKHLRKNKLAPSDDEFELSDVQTTPNKQPWGRTPSPKKMLSEEDLHNNWESADELQPADQVQRFRRSQPNFDTEDDLQL